MDRLETWTLAVGTLMIGAALSPVMTSCAAVVVAAAFGVILVVGSIAWSIGRPLYLRGAIRRIDQFIEDRARSAPTTPSWAEAGDDWWFFWPGDAAAERATVAAFHAGTGRRLKRALRVLLRTGYADAHQDLADAEAATSLRCIALCQLEADLSHRDISTGGLDIRYRMGKLRWYADALAPLVDAAPDDPTLAGWVDWLHQRVSTALLYGVSKRTSEAVERGYPLDRDAPLRLAFIRTAIDDRV